MRSSKLGFVWLIASLPLAGQWLNYPTAGIPRTPDGKANLSAPAPRLPDGKPDLSGIWQQPNGVKYTVNLTVDLKPGEVSFQPWAEALYKQRKDTLSKDDPVGHCNVAGVPQMNAVPYPYKIIQRPDMVVILYEALATFRQIFTDGRELPKDPNPTWMGYSVGRWDGDTLVVESAGFNDKSWLDSGGLPHSDALQVTERFHRRDFGHIDFSVTINDAKAYTKPFTAAYEIRFLPDTELMEYVCGENNKDLEHLVGK